MGRPSAISTKALGIIAAPFSTIATFLKNPSPVSEHSNQAYHSINEVLPLIPLELIRSNRDSVRKARETHLIDKVMTLEPRYLNRHDELN